MVSRLSLLVAVAVGSAACGGSSATKSKDKSKHNKRAVAEPAHVSAAKAAEAPPKKPEPVKVDVKLVRIGDSVRLDVSGVGRHRHARDAMERPDNWLVHLLADDQMMPRTVNGSVKIERFEVGNPALQRWDIEVGFSVAYAIPAEAKELTVRITAPDSPMFERKIKIESIFTKKSKSEIKAEREAKRAKAEAEKRERRRKAREKKKKKKKRDAAN